MTNEFIEELNEKLFEDERIFKYKDAVVDNRKNFHVELLVSKDDYHNKLDDKLRNKVFDIVREILPTGFVVSIDYIIAVQEEATLIRLMLEYIQKDRPNFYSLFAAVPISVMFNNDLVTVILTLEKFLYDYATESNLEKDLIAFFNTIVLEDVEIGYSVIPNSEGTEIKQTEYVADVIRVVEVQPIQYLNGKSDFSYVRYICDVVGKEASGLTLCGVISGIKCRFIEKIKKDLYVFNLNDTTETVKVKFFAKPNNKFDWKDIFIDGATMMLAGKMIFDNFDKTMVFMANRVALCAINYDSINIKSNFNKEYSDYRYIFPEKYHDVSQENLFEKDDLSERLKGTRFCVFDLETTGLDVANDEIIEIGAIKIIDGKFTESFSTFVRPEKKIPPIVVEKTGIKNEDVALAPTPQNVLPDFYRFCKDCTLVGHNIKAFDVPLLNNNAAKYKYEFNNGVVDTLLMARNLLPGGKYKLIDVCNRLGVVLDGAHRAVNDVAANAKVFLKLLKLEK